MNDCEFFGCHFRHYHLAHRVHCVKNAFLVYTYVCLTASINENELPMIDSSDQLEPHNLARIAEYDETDSELTDSTESSHSTSLSEPEGIFGECVCMCVYFCFVVLQHYHHYVAEML